MILSNESLMSNQQAVTATALSTNIIDTGELGTPVRGVAALRGDVGKGTPIEVLVQVTEDFNNLTSLKVAIETGTTASLGTVLAEETIAVADLVAGKRSNLRYLPTGANRFIGIRYTVTGSAPTTGKVTAGVTQGIPTNIVGV